MRVAAIFGPGCSPKNLKPFQTHEFQNQETINWRTGLPSATEEVDVILLLGGDGTVHRHLSRLANLRLPVLIVAFGSGNDFARALGLRHLRDSLAAWQRYCSGHGNVRAVDLGVISPLNSFAGGAPAPHKLPHYFCTVAGIGLDGEVARRANRLPRWLRGHGGYALALSQTALRFAPFPMTISTPKVESGWSIRSNQPTTLAAFANTSTYGGGMKIARHAKMDDGQLDACVVGSINPFRLFCLFPTVYFGRHLRISEVNYFQAAHFRIETEAPLDVYADGEYVCQTPVEITVHPGALRVVTP